MMGYRLNVRLSDQEREYLYHLANELNVSPSETVRKLLTSAWLDVMRKKKNENSETV